MLFPSLIGGGGLAQRVSIHADRIEVDHRGRRSTLLWRDVASAKAFEHVLPQAKLDPDFHGRIWRWLQKQPPRTLVLEGRAGEVVSIGLAAFRNQEEMLDAVRRRLEAAGGPPIEVVPAQRSMRGRAGGARAWDDGLGRTRLTARRQNHAWQAL